MDLCEKDRKRAYAMFRPRKEHRVSPPHHATSAGGAGKGKPGKRKFRSPRYDYEMLGAKFMSFAPKEPFSAASLNGKMKLNKSTLFRVARHLVTTGKLKSTGIGAGRKLTRV